MPNTISSLVEDKGERVLLLMYSYGGALGSNVIDQTLTFTHRRNFNKPDGVIHLIYTCGYYAALQPGPSLAGKVSRFRMKGIWTEWFHISSDRRTFPKDPAGSFYKVMSAEETEFAVGHLVSSPFSICEVEASRDPWRELLVTHVSTVRDEALAKAWWDEKISDTRAHGGDIRVVVYDVAHSPIFTIKETVRVVVDAAGDERNLQ